MPSRHCSCPLLPLSLLLLLFALFFPPRELRAGEVETRPSRLELAVGSGYAWGELRHGEELQAVPVFVRIGFEVSGTDAGAASRRTLYAILEPFANPLLEPAAGIEAGCGVGLRYLHGIAGPVSLYLEGAVAPTYFSVATAEQGAAGINFLEYAGSGLEYRLGRRSALFLGFRFRHLSHAGIADRSNDGINSQAIVSGISWQL